jgi:hypothetical protein
VLSAFSFSSPPKSGGSGPPPPPQTAQSHPRRQHPVSSHCYRRQYQLRYFNSRFHHLQEQYKFPIFAAPCVQFHVCPLSSSSSVRRLTLRCISGAAMKQTSAVWSAFRECPTLPSETTYVITASFRVLS